MARSSVTLTSTRQRPVHFPPTSGLPANLSLSRQRESMCASHGLLNAPGDNNCFLNSAVQIFWHLDVFRRSFRRLTDHVCLDNACIFCGIKMLFRQFQESVDSALAPDMLRRALASTFEDQQRFQLGCMDDAAECFENILLRIHYHVQGTSEVASCMEPLCIPHRKFSMDLVETFACNDCQYSSEPTAFSQMVHYVTVEGLVQKSAEMQQRGVKSLTGLFGKLIRKANESGDQQRVCRRCSSRNAGLKRQLTNRPDIITIGLAWPSEQPAVQTIADVLHSIDTNICLCHLYHSARDAEWTSSAVHHLVGMICFYGRHYVSFFYHSRYQTWMHFDDASVKVIGPDFSRVLAKCIKGHMQPLLLFYANPEFETIGDDVRYVAASDTSSCLSGKSSGMEPEEKRAAPVKPLPPRPPLRTVSRTSPYQQQHPTALINSSDHLTASSITTPTVVGSSNPHTSGSQCSRQNSRASVTSSSIASLESFDFSIEHFRSAYGYSPRSRNSIESSTRDETDSGCPSSGDHASSSCTSSSSSVEVPTVKRDPLKSVGPPPTTASSFTPVNRTHYIQMLLRADDLISSGSLKEDKLDLAGAIKLFEQAAGLLQSCVEPLKFCPQLSQAVSAKQMDCYKRLRLLHDKLTAHRSASTTSGASHASASRGLLPDSSMTTIPPHLTKSAANKLTNKYSKTDQPKRISSQSAKPEIPQLNVPVVDQNDAAPRPVHKSRRKATAKNGLGSREANRSMPDLSLSGEEKNVASQSTTLATFQSPTSYATICLRSAARETLLNELSQRFQRRAANARAEEEVEENDVDDEELPPPPPELLPPPEDDLPESSSVCPSQSCTLCGHRRVAQGLYCSDCQIYLNRFTRR